MDKIRVLVIDDEEDFLKILQLNLEEAKKYEVFPLSNAKELIATVHRFKPQVILMDLRMPGIGGIEACEMLNNDPLGRGIPILEGVNLKSVPAGKYTLYCFPLKIGGGEGAPVRAVLMD